MKASGRLAATASVRSAQGICFESGPAVVTIAESTASAMPDNAIKKALLSIAMEGLALSNIINTQSEGISYAMGLPDGGTGPGPAFEHMLRLNESVRRTLEIYANMQMLLDKALSDILKTND